MTLQEFLVYAPREFLRPFLDDDGDLVVDEVTLNSILQVASATIENTFGALAEEQKKELIVYETLSRLLLRQGQFELANQLMIFISNKVQAYAAAKSNQGNKLIVSSEPRVFTREEIERW